MEHITIPGFENMSKQEIFDMSVAHINKTGKQSTNGISCCYSGSGCAAAPFIREEVREDVDFYGPWCNLRSAGLVPFHELLLISAIQVAHDNIAGDEFFMQNWRTGMRQVASEFGLNASKLDVPVEL